jgi:VWFA-related protein
MKPLTRIAVLPCLAAGLVCAAGWPTAIQAQDAKPTFRASVALVPITAAVRDSHNRLVRGLTKTDFDVLENSQRREIVDFVASDDAAVSLAIVADTSGSMRGRNWERANDFVDQLVGRMTRPDDEMALFTFDKRLDQHTPFTTDRDSVLDAMRSVEAWGQTALYDAVAEAARRVADRRGRRAVIVITDGLDTISKMTASEVSGLAGAIDVPVYAVSVTPLSTPAAAANDSEAGLAQLAYWTGGDVSHLAEAPGLDRAINALVTELRQQYFLAIQSDSTTSGWHRIDVKTRRRDLTVRARMGYFAAGTTPGVIN